MDQFTLGNGQIFVEGNEVMPAVTAADFLAFLTEDPRCNHADFVQQTVLAAADDLGILAVSLEANGSAAESRIVLRIMNRLGTCHAIQERMDRAHIVDPPRTLVDSEVPEAAQ